MYEKKRKNSPPSLEELEKEYNEWLAKYPRKHGKTAKLSDDPETRRNQIYKNLKSMQSRQRRKEYDKRVEQSYVQKYGFGADDADANGIRPIDRRRYKAKFANCPHGAVVELKYLMMMTGLTLKQVYLLQQETGLKPYPAVTEKVADKDQKIRDREGIYI